jgi:hypothetical protein
MDANTELPEVSQATRQEVTEVVKVWRETKAERLAQDKIANKLKSEETRLKKWLIDTMHTQEYEGVVIDGYITGAVAKQVPSIVDREMYLDHIRTTGELDLLQFRPATGAIKARMEDEVEVPGVELIDIPDLYNRKA